MKILVLVIGCAVVFDGFSGEAAPRPCPQFLPVAVRLENPPPYILKGTTIRKNEKENFITLNKKQESLLENDLLPPEAKKAEEIIQILKIEPTTEKKNDDNKVVNDSTFLPKRARPGVTKLRNNLKKNSDSKRIILSENSSWMLKTINDQPAEEVLLTDKASIARDLQNSTESALVMVHKLEEKI